MSRHFKVKTDASRSCRSGTRMSCLAGRPSPAPRSPRTVRRGGPDTVADTPCSASARSCVDLDDQKAWLIQAARWSGPGGDRFRRRRPETPEGPSAVYLKDKDHKSNEFHDAERATGSHAGLVFWGPGGIAFHSGDPNKASAGCVHLSPADAPAWFASLQMGDEVQVHGNGTPGTTTTPPR